MLLTKKFPPAEALEPAAADAAILPPPPVPPIIWRFDELLLVVLFNKFPVDPAMRTPMPLPLPPLLPLFMAFCAAVGGGKCN